MKRVSWFSILLLFVSITAYAGDLKEIRNRTRDMINENESETEKHWPDSVLNWRINDAQSIISGLVTCSQAETTYTLETGKLNYPLPGKFYMREAAMFRSKHAVTDELYEEPRYLPHRRRKDIGTGFVGERDPVQFFSIWGDSIMFYPTPRTTDQVTLYFIARPDTLTADSSTLVIPEPMEAIIPFYVASQCWWKVKNYTHATTVMEMFLNTLNTMAARYENALKSEFTVQQEKTAPVTLGEP